MIGSFAFLLLAIVPIQDADPEPVRVAVVGSEPFVIEAGEDPEGLAVDIWRAVEERIGFQTEFAPVGDIHDINAVLEDVAGGRIDVAIGPISITAARAEGVEFSQPYYHSNLAIMAPASQSLFSRFAPFFTRTFIMGATGLLGVLVLVGTLLWIAERRANPDHFPHKGLGGVGNGIWMALVTMTTVGYGDRVPQTLPGRVITGIWMLISLVIASSLTAFLATALTLSQMQGATIGTADELRGRRVAAVRGTTSETFAASFGARVLPVADVAEGVAALEEESVQAFVFDRPMLRYYLNQRPELEFRIAPAAYRPQNYGFAAEPGSGLAGRISMALLQLQEEGTLERIEEEWLGQ